MRDNINTMSPSEAAKDLLAAKWDGTLPVNPVAIANSLGLKVFVSKKIPPGEGRLCRVDGELGILVCEYDSNVRKRFTAFHEIGHYVLGHYQEGTTLHRKNGISYDPRERDANAFAAEMLMPESSLRACVNKGYSFNKLINTFQASTPAMDRRLKVLGIV